MFFRTALLLLALLASCSRTPEPPFSRIAVPPFENLTGDAALDWVSAVSPYILSSQTVGDTKLLAVRADSDRNARALRANRVLDGYFVRESGGLRFHAALRDVAGVRTVRVIEARGGVLEALHTIAASLTGQPRAFASHDPAAIELFGQSLLQRDPSLSVAAFQKDPKLYLAALNGAQGLLARQDPAGARALLQKAVAAQEGDWERAQLDAALAGLEQNRQAILQALLRIAKSSPNDTDLLRQLAAAAVESHRYQESIGYLKRAVSLEPDRDELWNALAYSQAYARDFQNAMQSLEQYRKAAPDHPNTLDTAGEIHWMAGRFAEAEKFFLDAQQKDPSFLGGLEFSKAAYARFLAGDTPGADALFARYIGSRRAFQDAYADLRQAHWLYLTGRTEQGIQAMRKAAQTTGDPASRAGALLAIFLVQQGKQPEAFETAKRALSLAKSPAAANTAAIAAFLSQPPGPPGEWQSRADRSFSTGVPAPLRNQILAYALVAAGHGSAAAKVLDPLFAAAPPSSYDELRMLLAGAKLLAGDNKSAAELLGNHPLPPVPGDAPFASLYFPRYLEWRKQAQAPASQASRSQ